MTSQAESRDHLLLLVGKTRTVACPEKLRGGGGGGTQSNSQHVITKTYLI